MYLNISEYEEILELAVRARNQFETFQQKPVSNRVISSLFRRFWGVLRDFNDNFGQLWSK